MMPLLHFAKSMFPNMPDAVLNIWLAPLITLDGWPFRTVNDFTYGTRWHQYLDGNSLKAVSQLKWQRQQIPIRFSGFYPSSRQIIRWIVDAHVRGISTPCSRIKQGRARESFQRSQLFAQKTGRLHSPIVLIKQITGYQIMDGNHRVAAALSIPQKHLFTFDCWVGTKTLS